MRQFESTHALMPLLTELEIIGVCRFNKDSAPTELASACSTPSETQSDVFSERRRFKMAHAAGVLEMLFLHLPS